GCFSRWSRETASRSRKHRRSVGALDWRQRATSEARESGTAGLPRCGQGIRRSGLRHPSCRYRDEWRAIVVERDEQPHRCRTGAPLSLSVMNSHIDVELARAAVKAVSQWRYTPTLLNGQPVEIDTTITVNFKL